jgi:hypothetical protein
MLEQSTWGCNKDIHSGKTVTLILEVLSADDDTS